MKISIIVPCYNEESVIDKLYSRVTAVMQSIKEHSYEILLINDGSKDKTESIIFEYEKKDSHIKVYSFVKNFGHQAAVSCGIHNCTGDIAIIIDADLQDPPEILPDMIKLFEKTKSPIIYGKRAKREGESFLKKITAKVFYRVMNMLSETKFPVDTGDFRLIDKNVIDTFREFKERPKYIRGLISWMGYEQIPFEYERKAREAGETKYTLKKMIKLATVGILSFSTRPLKLAMFFGVFSIIVALVLTARVFILYFVNPSVLVPGWASIIITTLFIGGVQSMLLAIIGEYIGNMFNEIKNRPEYIVKKQSN